MLNFEETETEFTYDLFTCRRDIASCPLTKQRHLGICNNRKLHTSTLVMTELFRSTADFALALSNIKILIILKRLKYDEAYNFIKKETLVQVFSSEFCEISINTFFYRTPLVAASVLSYEVTSCRKE